MPLIEQRAALWAQYALYVLLFVITILGWAGPTPTATRSASSGSSTFRSLLAGITRCQTAFRLASHLQDSDRRNRRAPYRGGALTSARQTRSSAGANAARELSASRPRTLRIQVREGNVRMVPRERPSSVAEEGRAQPRVARAAVFGVSKARRFTHVVLAALFSAPEFCACWKNSNAIR
jgi:hypothetical protein